MIRIPTLAFAAAAVLAVPAAAQTFTVDSAQSNWTFSGTTSLGPIVGVPSNMFQVSGTIDASLTGGGSPVGTAAITGSSVDVPTIGAEVPGLPFLPPLASISITGVNISFTAPSVAVAPDGSATMTVTPLITSGNAAVDLPIIGQQNFDLSGLAAPPTAAMLSFAKNGTTLMIDVPMISIMVDIMEPTSGLTASVSLTGAAVATYECPASLVGSPGSISLATGGSQALSLDTCLCYVSQLYFVMGSASGTSPGLPADGNILPLNFDDYLLFSIANANGATFANTLGFLSPSGQAAAAINVPTGLGSGLTGVVLNHAYLVLGPLGNVVFTSNAAPLTLVP